MADTPLFLLDAESRYRLAHDADQWIVQRKRPNGKWRPLAVALRTRGDLFTCLINRGILITPEALRRIDTELMTRFVDWKAARAGECSLNPIYHDCESHHGEGLAPSARPGGAGPTIALLHVEPGVDQKVPPSEARAADKGSHSLLLPTASGKVQGCGTPPDEIDMPPIPAWLRRGTKKCEEAA